MSDVNAAENLLGLTLDSGWVVVEKIDKPAYATGAFFSVCYKVAKENRLCFLKAFNFARFFQLASSYGQTVQVVDVISEMLDAYKYERDLSALCRDHHVTKVAFVVDSGEQIVPGYSITVVPYLVFDLADSDVRKRLRFAADLEAAWKLKSLHSVAVGLKQLHAIEVSHQDLKPSNVLLFKDESKLGDLGRSICRHLAAPHDDVPFAGDVDYAPPEILYGHYESDWRTRCFGADIYLFGSLVAFYFAGVTMNAMLRSHLPDDVSWERFTGSYEEVQGHVLSAFALALEDFQLCVADGWLRAELRSMVEYLCHPQPERRGHPKGLRIAETQHDLERVVSRLDLLYRRAEYELTSLSSHG